MTRPALLFLALALLLASTQACKHRKAKAVAMASAPGPAPELAPAPAPEGFISSATAIAGDLLAPAHPPAPAEAPVEQADPGSYTLAELATHNTANSLWIAVDGKVYDLTDFADMHPGGFGKILGVAGTDATRKFAAQHGLESMQADMLAEYLIGDLAA